MMGNVVADEELRYGDTVPNGTYRDMVVNLPVCDPDKIMCPVLIIRAEHDGIATDEDVMGFFSRLPNADKQMTKIGGLAHTALLGINRHRFYHAVAGFLTMPERRRHAWRRAGPALAGRGAGGRHHGIERGGGTGAGDRAGRALRKSHRQPGALRVLDRRRSRDQGAGRRPA
jgi:hypothetical protein